MTFDELNEAYRRLGEEQRAVVLRVGELEDQLTAAKLRLQALLKAREQLLPVRNALEMSQQEDPLGIGEQTYRGEGPKP